MNLYYSICVLGILVTFEGFVIGEKTVVITPVNATIYENDSVTLACTLMDIKFNGIIYKSEWYVNSPMNVVGAFDYSCKDIKGIDASLYEYTCPNRTQVTWTIKKVTRKNHGDGIACILTASGVRRTIHSEKTFLNVQVPVSSASIIVPNTSEVTLVEETEEVFKCKTAGGLPEATVTWYKDPGTSDTSSDDVEITSNIETSSSTLNDLIEVTSTLRYSPRRNDNGWRIYCTASNIPSRDPSISDLKLLLNVHYDAFITHFAIDGNIEDENEEKIQLTCKVDSNPASTVKIMSEGNTLKEESNVTTLSVIHSNVACRYRGDYTCEASNSYGHPSRKVLTLFVKCLSKTSSSNMETNITGIILGTILGIVCAVLAVYGVFITVLYRRKQTQTDVTSSNEAVEQRTYANLNVTENRAYQEEHAQTNEDEDDTARQYTDLIQHSNDDRTTYEVIQAAN